MSGRTDKMKKLLAERDRLKAQIEALTNELKGLDRAIAVMNGDDGKEATVPAPRNRARNVKETVLTLVQKAGPTGINVNGVMDAAKEIGHHLERGTVSSLLSRMKRENVLEMSDGKYFVPPPKQTGVASATH